jgi:predicted ATPase
MIRAVRISNYKSIREMDLRLGRVTVFIGANGSGKSNILEAIAFASAASQNKLDNEFLASRGIRVTEPSLMFSAFESAQPAPVDFLRRIDISVEGEKDVKFHCTLFADETKSHPRWRLPLRGLPVSELLVELQNEGVINTKIETPTPEILKKVLERWESMRVRASGPLPEFLIFAPEYSALRTFQAEGQILPLGIKGEGLFAHLQRLGREPEHEALAEINERLKLIDWFESFDVPQELAFDERSIRIRDRYLAKGAIFDQRSANEGFLFLLFYLTLLVSPDAPSFFAIDNVDSSLNPKLCTALIKQLALLAQKYGKQVILTTHNPAVLDGLSLNDEEQRLLVVDRNKDGHSRVHRIEAPKVAQGQLPVRLSEAFLRGYIGGLPKNF